MTKTYQAMVDEAAERAEAEAVARRDAAAQEATSAEEARVREAIARGELGSDAAAADEVDDVERDLDEDVPEAENAGEDGMDEDDDDELGDDDDEGAEVG